MSLSRLAGSSGWNTGFVDAAAMLVAADGSLLLRSSMLWIAGRVLRWCDAGKILWVLCRASVGLPCCSARRQTQITHLVCVIMCPWVKRGVKHRFPGSRQASKPQNE